MNEHDATEQAYINGYSAGYEAGRRSALGEQKNPTPNAECYMISPDYYRGWNDAISAMNGKWRTNDTD